MLLALALAREAVSFTSPAEAASKLLPRLGVAMGLHLEADRRTGTQVLLLRVHDMAPNRLLTLVAEVVGGEWERTDDGLRLTIDANNARREETKARGT